MTIRVHGFWGAGAAGDLVASGATTLPPSLDDLPNARRSVVEARPATDSTCVYVGTLNGAYHYGPADIVGVGHLVGAFGITDNRAPGTAVAAAFAVEGRVHATTGHQAFTSAFTPAVQGQSEGAGGTIGIHTDYHSPELTDHDHINVRFCLINSDPNKPIKTAGVIDTPGGRLIPRSRVGAATGRYYPIEGVTGLYAGVPLGRGVVWAVPIVVPDRAVYTRIGFTLGSGIASCTARLGLYADAGGVPGDLILDAGTVSCGTGDVGAREVVIAQDLFPGLFWICIQAEGGAGDPAITWAGVNAWSVVGMSTPTAHDSAATIANTGALPASFGAASMTGAGFAPFMWLRVVP